MDRKISIIWVLVILVGFLGGGLWYYAAGRERRFRATVIANQQAIFQVITGQVKPRARRPAALPQMVPTPMMEMPEELMPPEKVEKP